MKTKTKFVLHWVNPEGSQNSCAHFTGGETEALRAVTQQVHSRKDSRSQVCCPRVWCAHHQLSLGRRWTEWHRASGWKAGKMPVWQGQGSNVVQRGFRNLPIGPVTAPSPAPAAPPTHTPPSRQGPTSPTWSSVNLQLLLRAGGQPVFCCKWGSELFNEESCPSSCPLHFTPPCKIFH